MRSARPHGASRTFWTWVWRKLYCSNHMRRFEGQLTQAEFIDCGYCLDRYITEESK